MKPEAKALKAHSDGRTPPVPTDAPAPSRALDHPETAAIRLETVLGALSDPVRLTVVRALSTLAPGEEMACSDVDLRVSKSTTTHHYRVLREAGVISQIYRGTSKMNALRRPDLDALFPSLLDSVLRAANEEERRLGAAPEGG